MARFYGWTHEEILQLPHRAFLKYHLAIGNVMAEEKLHSAEVTMLPKMKHQLRKKVWQRFKKEVSNNLWKPRVESDEEFMKKLSRMMGNG